MQTGDVVKALKSGAISMVLGAAIGAGGGAIKGVQMQKSATVRGPNSSLTADDTAPGMEEYYGSETDPDFNSISSKNVSSPNDAQIVKEGISVKYEINELGNSSTIRNIKGMSRADFLKLAPDAQPVSGKPGLYSLPDGSTYYIYKSTSGGQPSINYQGTNGTKVKLRFDN